MKHLLAFLLLFSSLITSNAAQLVGAVRANSDNTGTNTTGTAVTITSRTNLNAGVVNATNSINIGVSGEAGEIQIQSDSGTYTLTISVTSAGVYAISNNTVLIDTLSASSGYGGTGTKFRADDGTYKTITSPAGQIVTNININPTTGYLPYRSNSTTFGDSPWYRINTNRVGFNSTSEFLKTVSENVAIGNSLAAITSGDFNFAAGKNALNANSTGNSSTAVGYNAGAVSTSSANTYVGTAAGASHSSGANNVFVGAPAMPNASTVSDSVVMGSHPLQVNDSTSRTVRKSVWLGGLAGTSTVNTNWTSATNFIVIGYEVTPRADNIAQIGTNGVSVLYLNGTVGWFRGSGTPEGNVAAPVGSYYTREDGGAGTTMYVKESGSGNTGWVGK